MSSKNHNHSHENGHEYCNHDHSEHHQEQESEPLLDHHHKSNKSDGETSLTSSTTFFNGIRYGLKSQVLQLLADNPQLANERGSVTAFLNFILFKNCLHV